jgi:hypothetical protein
MRNQERLLRSQIHTSLHIAARTSGRSASFCGSFTPKETLERDKRSLTILLIYFNVALALTFIMICSYSG